MAPVNGPAFDGSYVFTLGYDGLVPRFENIGLNDYIQVKQTLTLTNIALVKIHSRIVQPQSLPNTTDISANFQLIGETLTSPGNRIVKQAGVTQADIGQFVTISGCTNGGNNTTVRIVGIADSVTAYVDKVLVTEGPRSTITATQLGLRWKLSLLVDISGTPTEMARVVQSYDEQGFYRNDLSMNVSKMTGSHTIYFRLTLIQQQPNDIYPMS
jgi:hypothetical protein